MSSARVLRGLSALALAALVAATSAQAQIAFRDAEQASVSAAGTITFRGVGSAPNTTGGCPATISPSTPAGTVGDLLLAVVVSIDGGTLTPSAGWNTQFSGDQTNHRSRVYYRYADGSAADNLTVTKTVTCTVNMHGQVARFNGVDPVQPFEPTVRSNFQNSGTIDHGGGTINAAVANSMSLFAVTTSDNDASNTPAGFTEAFDSGSNPAGGGNDTQIALYYRQETTTGAKGPFSTTKGGGSDNNYGVFMMLRGMVNGITIRVPAGTVADDVMIASIGARPCSATNGGACTTTITPPTPPGTWTLVNSFHQTGGGGTGGFGNILYVYRRVATGAEPAAYSWGLGGTPVNNGAVGGIVSFSGVDTTNPIVDDLGQVTPSAASHTAPSINTGTVTDTMLVGSFVANSSATWTTGAMTDAVDIPSLTLTNDLGLSIVVAYEARAAAGPTGTRAATQSTPPANDTGATHLLALRPAPAVHHYAVSVVSTTVANCDFAEVTISAHNAAHGLVNPPATRTVTLSVSNGAATAGWGSLISGAGTWTPSGSTATYTWPGTQSSFTVRLRQSAVVSLTVNANDTFVTEDGAEDPAISFVNSALRVSDGANNALSIGSQIAAKPSNTGTGTQSLFLQAIRTDTTTGACVSVFPNGSEVDINVGAQCNNPAACTQNVTLTTTSGSGAPSGSFVPAGAGTYPATIRFRFTTADAEAPFNFNYADAGQITLQFRHITAAPATTIAGTSNAFVTRPFGLAFRGADAGTAIQHGTLATSPLLAAAGDNFTMTLAAYRWVGAEDDGTGNPLAGANLADNGLTPNFAASTSVSATGGLPGAPGTVARGVGCAAAATIAAGSWSGGAATVGDWCYSEVGNVFLGATASDYLGSGANVTGNSGLDGTGAAGGYVGRFRPKHFVVTGGPTLTNRATLACATSTFTYLGEPLSLGFTLEARNAQNALTQHYAGAYARLDLSTVAGLGIGARSGTTNLTGRVDASLAPSGSFVAGSAALSAPLAIQRRVPDNPDGPFAATQFGIAPADADGVQMQSYNQDVDGNAVNEHFAVGPSTELRFGRLRLANGYGPDSAGMQLPLDVQYWGGGSFTLNAQDSCTSLARANIALSFSGVIAACDTAMIEPSITFAAGVSKLTLAAPGAGKTGVVTLAANLATDAGSYCPAKGGGTAVATNAGADYLLGRWDDGANPDADPNTAYDDPPTGRASFGLYGSQPRNFIFFRENF